MPFDLPSVVTENFYERTHSALSFSSFKFVRNSYHKLILSPKKKYYSDLVSSSSDTPRRLRQTVNKLLGILLTLLCFICFSCRQFFCFFLYRQDSQTMSFFGCHLHCSFSSLTFTTSSVSSVLFLVTCFQIRNIKDTS